jgi:hypothetical protein
VYGVKHAKTTEKVKAFSQNMMHETMEITDRLYGLLAGDDVKNTITHLREKSEISSEHEELFRDFLSFIKWVEKRK